MTDIVGTSSGETLNGTSGDDYIQGLGGNDILNGLAGNDILDGGDGNDILDGGAGNDTIDGGAGVDTVSYLTATGAVTVNLSILTPQNTGAGGTDTITNVESVTGSNFGSNLTGNSGDNILTGGNGPDTLTGGLGNDILIGGNGPDTASYAGGPGVTVNLSITSAQNTIGQGVDTLTGIENLTGSSNNDVLIGDGNNNTIIGGLGDDLIFGGNGFDTAVYATAPGAVTIVLDGQTGYATGAAGNDSLLSIENVVGSNLDDVIHTGEGSNLITGGLGNDTIVDSVVGDNDQVLYTGATAAVTVNLALGTATGGAGSDTLVGIEGVQGSSFNDILIGDDQNNLFIGGSGNDTIDGGAGLDTASYATAGGGVTIDLNVSVQSANSGIPSVGVDTLTNIENVVGSSFNDTLTGDGHDNALFGLNGNDILSGGLGNDILQGGAGNDVLDGGGGTDIANYLDTNADVTVDLSQQGTPQATGGDGTDTLISIEGVKMGGGDDFITAGTGSTYFDGGAGSDAILFIHETADLNISLSDTVQDIGPREITLLNFEKLAGGSGNDFLTGNAADNVIVGGPGDDVMDGGAGNDVAGYYFATAGVTVSLALQGEAQDTGGDGVDTLNNFENLVGSNFDDVLTGDGNDNILLGGDGTNILDGGAGNDTASYGDAGTGVTVSLAITGPQNTVGAGTDTLISIENLLGSEFNDVLTGDGGANVLNGGDGNDVLSGGDGNDLLIGGFGNDVMDGGAGFDIASYGDVTGPVTVNLGVTGAQFTNSGGVDTLTNIEGVQGGALNDWLFAANSGSTLMGMAGNDLLFSGSGNDVLNGGDGYDLAIYGPATAAVTVDLSVTGPQNTGGGGVDTLISIEGVVGSAFNDKLTGGAGNDYLSGGAGNDTLKGGDGDDNLVGGLGNDTLNGNAGVDTASYADVTAGVTVSLALQGTAQNTVGGGVDTLNSIENLGGSQFDDKLTGDGGNNTIIGLGGNDILNGGGGFDMVGYGPTTAGPGNTGVTVSLALQGTAQDTGSQAGIDTLTNFEGIIGSAYNDVLSGDGNDNTLIGGAGDDRLYGGDGNDLLMGQAGNDVLDGGAGNDTVSYADAQDGVTIDLGYSGMQGLGDPNGWDQLISIEGFIGSAHGDRITASGTTTFVDGGDGFDVVFFTNAASGVSVNLNLTGPQDVGGGQMMTIQNVEGVSGGQYNDTLIGTSADEAFQGGGGLNTIDGGGGVDRIAYVDATSGVTVDLASGVGNYGSAVDTLINIEGIIGSSFDDVLTGDAGDNTFDGGLGNDVIVGGGGNDWASFNNEDISAHVDLAIDGPQDTGQGMDSLTGIANLEGSTQDDQLYGDASNNILRGGAGNDILDGRGGVDTVDYSDAENGVTVSLALQGQQQITGWGNDTLVNNENLIGSSFDDILSGDSGANVIEGGAGNDILTSGGGLDTASYASAAAGVTVSLASQGVAQNTQGAGVDTLNGFVALQGSAFADSLTGDGADNTLMGGAGNDSLNGGAGNDTLVGGAGDDTLNGGAGIDTASYADATAGVTVSLAISGAQNTVGAGIDTLLNMEGLAGSSFDDALTGNAASNVLVGGDGNDFLDGAGGADTLLGGAGDDWLHGGAGNDTLDGGAGSNTADYGDATAGVSVDLTIGGAQNTRGAGTDTLTSIQNLQGSAFADTLIGTAGSNTLTGGNGGDLIIAGGGDDNLNGGNGDDVLQGGGGGDYMDGGAGNDIASYADAGGSVTVDLTLSGPQSTGFGVDTLVSIEGVIGSDFADTLTASDVDNVLSGGKGSDTVLYALATAGVTVDLSLASGQATGGSGTDTLVSIENLVGSSHDDNLSGNSLKNTLSGGDGNDTLNGAQGDDSLAGGAGNDSLFGGSGNDSLIGGSGDDFLNGGAGDDTLNGGGGNDTADYGNAGSAVTVSLAVSGAQNTGGGGIDTITQVENLSGSNFDDVLTGDGNDNILTGGAGNDTLSGGAGNDTLIGGDGLDTLIGGGGADRIIGGAGADTLTGGAGADTFVYGAASDSSVAAADTITDFAHATDSIDLSAIDANGNAGDGDQAFTWLGKGAFTNVAGQLHYYTDGSGAHVEGDINGDGVADFVINLTGVTTLGGIDFAL